MSSVAALRTRLKEVSSALSQISPLVSRLKNFVVSVGQDDETRLEIGAEIHARLKEVEEEMELLRVEVDALGAIGSIRRKGGEINEKEAEKQEVIALAERLMTSFKRTRGEFRTAQLQANRNAELSKRKERELLFSRPRDDDAQRKSSNKLTHDDLVVNASGDVTAALRRTHELMQAELSRSQFAQETLEQSTAALSSLSESYSNLDTLLSSSRALVSSLLRSQKSDTWYLETAFYILIGTIIWLVFRRILYGPLWWLAWVPIKIFYQLTIAMIGLTGFSNSVGQLPSPSVLSSTATPAIPTIAGTDGVKYTVGDRFNRISISSMQPDNEDLIEHIAQPDNDQQIEGYKGTNIDDISPEERKRQEEMPRNSKKRMFEENVQMSNNKDEL